MNIFINYKQNVSPDHDLAKNIESFLQNEGHNVFRDESEFKGGDEWPQKLLDGLIKSNVVISLISNAALKSNWVLNEIDEARNRKIPIIPIKLEPLDETLEFKRFRPRFADIQYIFYRSNTKLKADILRSINNFPLRYPYYDIITDIAKKHKRDTTKIICDFMLLLKDFHRIPAAFSDIDNGPKVSGMIHGNYGRSHPEALIADIKAMAYMANHNYNNAIDKKSDPLTIKYWESAKDATGCLSELFSKILDEWQDEVEEAKRKIKQAGIRNQAISVNK